MTYLKKLNKVVSLTQQLFNSSNSLIPDFVIESFDPIDEGGFGAIYLISPTLILKEYKCTTVKQSLLFAADEILSSLDFRYGLVPSSIVQLKENGHFALIKRYIHNNISVDKFNKLPISVRAEFDTAIQQYKVDNKGKIYRIDTQSSLALIISWETSAYTNSDEDIEFHLESRASHLRSLLEELKAKIK